MVCTSLQLSGYCDADWGTCPDSRKSISGYCIFMGSNLVSWKAKKQPTVSLSSAEAEYRSLSFACSEVLWLSYLLQAFHLPVHKPIPLHCDNKSALHVTQNPVFHERRKHIDLACHHVRNLYLDGFIFHEFLPGSSQLADLFTKALPGPVFVVLRAKLGLRPLGLREVCEDNTEEAMEEKVKKG